MRTTEFNRLVREIKADDKKRKRVEARLAEAKQARQRLARMPPKEDDLGGVRLVAANMSPQEFEMCQLYHSLLVHYFDHAISIRKRIEESTPVDKIRLQFKLEKFADECWSTIGGQCRDVTPHVYFQMMLPYANALMKVLKQRKQIKPTQSKSMQR